MPGQDEGNFSLRADAIDFAQLRESLYFNGLYSDQIFINKKSDINSSILKQSLPQYVSDSLPYEYLETLWQTRGDYILKDAVVKAFIAPCFIAEGINYDISRFKNLNKFPPEFMIRIKKSINSNRDVRLDLIRRAFVHYFFSFINGETETQWQRVCGLILCCPFLGIYLDISRQVLIKAMADETEAGVLLESLGDFITTLRSYADMKLLKPAEQDSSLATYLSRLSELKEYSFDSIGDLIKFDEFLSQYYLPFRRTYLHRLFKLKKELLPCLDDDLSSSFINLRGWRLAHMFNELYGEIMRHLHKRCQLLSPRKFSAQNLLTEIDRISPSLRPSDRKEAAAEIAALDNGSLEPERSWLLQIILPALRGERDCEDLDFDALEKKLGEPFPFSAAFAANLVRGTLSITDIKTELPVSSPEHEESAVKRTETEAKSEATQPQEAATANSGKKIPEEFSESCSELPNESTEESGAPTGEFTVQEESLPEISQGEDESDPGSDETMAVVEEADSEESADIEDMQDDSDLEGEGEEEIAGFYDPDSSSELLDENVSSIGAVRDEPEELCDYEDDEGVLDPLGMNFLKKGELEELGNIGALAEKADVALSAKPQPEKSGHTRRRRPQENGDGQLEDVLEQLMKCMDDGLAARDGKVTWDQAIASLLDNGDTAGLYWLSVSIGQDCHVPEWLAEMLHIGSRMTVRRPEERDRFALLLKQAIAAEALDEMQIVLLAATILRPAMIMPMADMATLLQTLENEALLCPVAHIFKKLKEIVFRDQPIPQAILQGQSGKQLAEASLANLSENTKKFLHRMRTAKTQYQPATATRRHMFGSQGELAVPLEKCLAGNFTYLEEDIDKLRDPRTYDDMINRNRTRKNNTRNIEAGVRETLLNDIAYCKELLEEWRDQITSDLRNDGDSREAWYHDTFQNVKLEGLGDSPALRFFKKQLDRLRNGLEPRQGPEPLAELRLWPLRLVCSEPSKKPVFKPESLAPAVYANEQNDAGAIAGSLVWHAIRGDYPLVRDFLEAWPEIGEISASDCTLGLSNSDLTKRLAFKVSDAPGGAEKIWEKKVNERLGELENLVVDSYFRGAININQQNEATLKLNDIETSWKESHNALDAISGLDSLEAKLSNWDETMLKEVLERVESLKEHANGNKEAIEFLESVACETKEDKSYSVAHDNIARMETWLNETTRPFPRRSVDLPSQMGAGKEFYDLLEREAIQPLEVEGKLWREGATLANRPLRAEYLGAITSLLRWLGFNLERSEQINVSYSDGRPQYWKVFSYNMGIKSPLPNWGSRANGRHTIAMGWNSPSPADIDKLMQSGRFRHNDAVTLIVFGSLSYADRLKIMKMGAEWRPFPLIIDSNAFHYLAGQPEEYRRQRLFEICLAGAPLNPYTPDARGDVPEEMFYGRKKDMDSVRDPSGACVIYGGRQLGKSALLLQIANGTKGSSQKLVLRKSIPEEATSLLEEALNCCIKAGLVHANTSRKTFPDKLRSWMYADRSRELLLLLDECDNVLEEDKKRKFAEVKTLRDLMQDTGSRFKVVLTGLHSVQRFSHEPNSPFYQLKSICIGPMDTDSAYQLMTEKLALLGINFESQKLVRMALNYCNYQPKLIQMFCHELLETVKNIPDRGPNYTIDRNTMLKVYASPQLREKIRDSFTMALALDKRYFVIGYVMALNSSNAISARDLLAELRDYWPDAFNSENCDANSLQTLLQEMEGLGLLISLEGGWRVRTPNIIEFLGGRENILDELVQYEQLPYEQPGNPDDLRMKTANIFTASQYNLLADKTSRMQWISGWSALGLDRVPDALKAITANMEYGSRIACVKISGKNKDEALAYLRREYGKINEGGLLAWISSSEFKNNIVDFMQVASAWLATLHSDKKYVKIICLISPRDFFRFIAMGYSASLSSHEIQLKPWSVVGMESYFLEKDMPANRTMEIMEATNGWPVLVERLMQAEEINISQIKEAVESSIVKEEAARMLRDLPKVAEVTETIIEIGGNEPIRFQDLAAVRPDEMDETTFRNVIAFLQAMFLLREKRGNYQLDSIAFPATTAS